MGYTRPIHGKWGIAILTAALAAAAPALAGESEQFVAAYNELVLMILDRAEVAGLPIDLETKNIAKAGQATVTQNDLGALREKTLALMQTFIDPESIGEGVYTIDTALEAMRPFAETTDTTFLPNASGLCTV